MQDDSSRPGEIALPFDPALTAKDAALVFIGRIRSPWTKRADCPRNLREARERGGGARLEIDEAWRPGLAELETYPYAILLYWMDRARRDLIVQKPRHRESPAGVFALRSPVRPNPIALAKVRILDIDAKSGIVTIDAIDALDGTPLLDIKPWFETVDGSDA